MKQSNSPFKIVSYILIAIAIIAAVYLLGQRTNYLPKATTSYQTYVLNDQVPEIKTTTDLETQLENLDGIDIDQITPDLTNSQTDAQDL